MCNDPDLLKWACAWHSHDKQLRSSFMDRPFIIDPDSSMYHHQFECAHLDLWTSMPMRCSPQPQAAYSASNCFAPYDKPNKPLTQNPLWSFHDPKNTLCLRCGMLGHHSNSCHSPSNQPDRPAIVNWKDRRLVNKARIAICVVFNVKGSCYDFSAGHLTHSCSLCGDSTHRATSCTHN